MDERAFPRIACDGVLRLGSEVTDTPTVARLVDLSRGGVCCLSPRSMDVGEPVYLEGLRTPLVGAVVRVEPASGDTYLVAVRFHEPMDEGLFRHVLDGMRSDDPERAGAVDRQDNAHRRRS